MIRRLLPALLSLSFLLPLTAADSWPEFRGPTADGHAPEAKVPTLWSATSKIRWKVPVPGKAWSSPVIADGRIYITSAVSEGGQLSLRAMCFELADGKPVWDREIFKKAEGAIHQKNSHASPTPVYAEGKLFVHFGHDGTAALNAGDGTILWTQTSLSYAPVHGNGGSPILHEGKLIFSNDGQADPFLVALNATDGSVAWKTPRNVTVTRTFSFSTPC